MFLRKEPTIKDMQSPQMRERLIISCNHNDNIPYHTRDNTRYIMKRLLNGYMPDKQ